MTSNYAKNFSLFLIFGLASINAGASNLCGSTEEVVFACDFSNKKSVAVCSGKEGGKGYMEYRYGQPSRMEMHYKAFDNDEKKKYHRAEVVYASNASEVLWFQKGDFFYLIHLPMRGGPLLDVMRDGRTISHQNCRAGWAGTQTNFDSAKKFFTDHGSNSIDAIAPLWGDE
jgi:hypothetical protein